MYVFVSLPPAGPAGGWSDAGETRLSQTGKPKDYRVAIVMLNWNSFAETDEALERLKPTLDSGAKVVLVDNGSANDEGARLRKRHPWIQLLEAGENLGFAGGCNMGIRWALGQGYHFIGLLNNDAYPLQRDWLEKLLRPATNGARIVVGPKIVYDSDHGTVWYAGGRLNLRSGAIQHEGLGHPADEYSGLAPTDYVCGCCLFASREAFQQVGLLDEKFFIYYEEADWNLRASAAGWKPAVNRDVVIAHKISKTMGTSGGAGFYYRLRNRLTFSSRWGGIRFPLFMFTRITVAAARDIVRATPAMRPSMLRLAGRAYFDFSTGRMGPLEVQP